MKYIYTREIKRRIVENRKQRGMTQVKMAEKLGMSSSAYSHKEKYEIIDYKLLKRIAEVLDVDITDLLYEDEIPELPQKV